MQIRNLVHACLPLAFCLLSVSFAWSADFSKEQLGFYKESAAKIEKLLEKHYPEISRTDLDEDVSSVTWEYETRKFMVHIPSLTGEWQDAVEMTGPKRKGVLCSIHLREGTYAGMAAVPQTFDRSYFHVLMMAPNNRELDCHLVVRLYYPAGVDPKFHEAFVKTVNRFDADRKALK